MPTSKHVKKILSSADYFEPLFRAHFVRAMRRLQSSVNQDKLTLQLSRKDKTDDVLTLAEIEAAMAPLRKVFEDAFRRGGHLGAEHLTELLDA